MKISSDSQELDDFIKSNLKGLFEGHFLTEKPKRIPKPFVMPNVLRQKEFGTRNRYIDGQVLTISQAAVYLNRSIPCVQTLIKTYGNSILEFPAVKVMKMNLVKK